MTNQHARRLGRTCECPVCGSPFYRKRAQLREVNYCSVRCSTKANYALHGVNVGRRRSPATEFPVGEKPHNYLPVGSVVIRQRRNRSEAARAWVKVADPNVWRLRSVLTYERHHGPIARGLVIHHVDGDALNDDPSNLVALTRSEHLKVHHPANISI